MELSIEVVQKKKPFLEIVVKAIIFIFILNGAYSLYHYAKNTQIRNYNNDFYKWTMENTNHVQSKSDVFLKNKQLQYNNKSIPVLMYHSIGVESITNPYIVSIKKFQEDMEYLNDNQYTTLSIDEFYNFIVNDVPIPKRSVLITFDDGYEDNYAQVYPILKQYSFKATIFVVAGYVDKYTSYLSSSQLKEMQKNGIDIECHTTYHTKLGELGYKDQLSILTDSKERLEKMLDKKIEFLSYPFGSYNLDTLKADKDAGYKMAFTTDGRWTDKSNGLLTMNRVFVSGYHHLGAFKIRVKTPWYLFKEFYF